MKEIKAIIQEKKMSSFLKRAYMSVIMLSLLIISMKYRFILLVTVFCLKLVAFKEVTNTLRERTKKYSSTILSWYLLIISDILLWRNQIIKIFKIVGYPTFTVYFSNFVVFSLYLIAIVYFISSLRKGTLRKQALHFVLAHFGILMINYPAFCICKNILIDKYWFIFPVLLVVSNDVFAYLVGKSFGKTPLIKISPKKTVEGFLGGFIFTLLTGLVCTYLKIHTSIFDSKSDDFSTTIFSNGSVLSNNTIISNATALNNGKEILLETSRFYGISMIWIHSAIFILFSSFCAPFGGLLASTFKRIFKIKDFADYLPGHGGITDRVDCQLLMGIFTHFYLIGFVYFRRSNTADIIKRIIKQNNKDEIIEITIGLLQEIV